MSKRWISILLLIILASINVIGAPNDSYRPYPHPFPQIIQANDYPTIEAIQTFVHEMRSAESNILSCRDAESIMMQHNYTEESVVILIATIKRLLDDLSLAHVCDRAGVAAWQTRAYKQISVIEFDFGPTVLIIYSFSNGPNNEERLYVLDTVNREESFWGTPLFERLSANKSIQNDASEAGASD